MKLRWKDVQLTSSEKYVVAMTDAESVRTSVTPFPPYGDSSSPSFSLRARNIVQILD